MRIDFRLSAILTGLGAAVALVWAGVRMLTIQSALPGDLQAVQRVDVTFYQAMGVFSLGLAGLTLFLVLAFAARE